MRVPSHWITLTLSVLTLAGMVVFDLYSAYETVGFKERERLTHQAQVINKNLSMRLQTTSNALDLVRSDLPELLGRQADTTPLKQRLRVVVSALSGVRSIQVVNADGVVIASNLSEYIGVNFHDGDRYQTISASADPAMLYISQPFVTRRGDYAISIAKAVLDDHGKFDGYILAIVDPGYFRVLLS